MTCAYFNGIDASGPDRGAWVFIQMYEKLFRYAEEHGLVSIWGFTPCSLFRRVHCKVGRLDHRTYCDGDPNPVRDSGRR